MVDRAGEFSFLKGTHVIIDMRIVIPFPIRPMTTKFGKEVHLVEFKQMRLIK